MPAATGGALDKLRQGRGCPAATVERNSPAQFTARPELVPTRVRLNPTPADSYLPGGVGPVNRAA